MKLGPVVQEEMSFKEKAYGRTYRKDVLRFLMVHGHCKFMGLTSEG